MTNPRVGKVPEAYPLHPPNSIHTSGEGRGNGESHFQCHKLARSGELPMMYAWVNCWSKGETFRQAQVELFQQDDGMHLPSSEECRSRGATSNSVTVSSACRFKSKRSRYETLQDF